MLCVVVLLFCTQGTDSKTSEVDVINVDTGVVNPGKGKKRRSTRLDPEVAAQLMALFGVEDEDDAEETSLDYGDKVASAETVGLINALRNRRAGGSSSSPVAKRAAATSTAAPASASSAAAVPPIATLLGMATGGSAASGTEFIDSLPPAQLLTVGGMFCPSLQAAGTLVNLTKEKCLQPSPQFESPEELSSNVTRIVSSCC